LADTLNNDSKHVTAMSVKMQAAVKRTNDGNLLGELNCKFFEEPVVFSSLMNMIEIMETTFDAKGFPEKQMLPRTFGKGKRRVRKHEAELPALLKDEELVKGRTSSITADGEVCSFEILVNYRHNAEWQGNIKWLERDVTKRFSSIVELIKLIDNALEE